MLYAAIKALLSGAIIAIVSEVAKRRLGRVRRVASSCRYAADLDPAPSAEGDTRTGRDRGVGTIDLRSPPTLPIFLVLPPRLWRRHWPEARALLVC